MAKEFHFRASYQLANLSANQQGGRLNGHNYVVVIELASAYLNADGFVGDYSELSALKHYIDASFDHRYLNDMLEMPSTAENPARHFHDWCKALAGNRGNPRVGNAKNLRGVSTMTLRIAELLGPTLQGEGTLMGEPTVFILAGGRDYRDRWCCSLHAVESQYRQEWAPVDPDHIWEKVRSWSRGRPLTALISGGNPALQESAPVIALGLAQGDGFACETLGSVPRAWLGDLSTLFLSPKPSASGETVDWDRFDACVQARRVRTVIKIVIVDEADLQRARAASAR